MVSPVLVLFSQLYLEQCPCATSEIPRDKGLVLPVDQIHTAGGPGRFFFCMR